MFILFFIFLILLFAFNVNFVGGNQGWYKGRLKASCITFLSFFKKKTFLFGIRV